MLKIVTVPDPVLAKPTRTVSKVDEKIKKLIKEMEETLISQKDPEGVGLAAPQVGHSLSLFIIKPSKNKPAQVFINPKVLEKKFEKKKANKKTKYHKLEGCLSIPKIWGKVRRPSKIYLQYQDITGKTKKEWFQGFEAQIIDHELDHLNGILFTKRAVKENQPLYQEVDKKLVKLSL